MPKSRVDRFDEAMGNFSKAFNEIETIKDELENWKDGIEGTNLENTDKFSDLCDAVAGLTKGCDLIDKALDHLEDVEIPGAYKR